MCRTVGSLCGSEPERRDIAVSPYRSPPLYSDDGLACSCCTMPRRDPSGRCSAYGFAFGNFVAMTTLSLGWIIRTGMGFSAKARPFVVPANAKFLESVPEVYLTD